MFPEHTSLAYSKAGEQGADFIECDIQFTKDLHLVCSHEPWIEPKTNVDCFAPDCGPMHEDFSDRFLHHFDFSDT